mgnify:CR=1 FL=1
MNKYIPDKAGRKFVHVVGRALEEMDGYRLMPMDYRRQAFGILAKLREEGFQIRHYSEPPYTVDDQMNSKV